MRVLAKAAREVPVFSCEELAEIADLATHEGWFDPLDGVLSITPSGVHLANPFRTETAFRCFKIRHATRLPPWLAACHNQDEAYEVLGDIAALLRWLMEADKLSAFLAYYEDARASLTAPAGNVISL